MLVVRGLRRVPFTLVMLLGIGTVGVLSGSAANEVSPEVLSRCGFALRDLWQGTWYSLVTEVWFTHSAFMYWGILGFVVLSIGAYEWRAGTRRSLLLYWLTDIGGTLIVTLCFVLPLYLAKTDLGLTLAFSDDVGMSGGGFGSIGGSVHLLSLPLRRWAFAGVLIYLVMHLVIVTDLSSDILHIVTFLMGFWLDGQLSSQFEKSNRGEVKPRLSQTETKPDRDWPN